MPIAKLIQSLVNIMILIVIVAIINLVMGVLSCACKCNTRYIRFD